MRLWHSCALPRSVVCAGIDRTFVVDCSVVMPPLTSIGCCCRSFSRSVGVLPLTSLLGLLVANPCPRPVLAAGPVPVVDRSVGMPPLTSINCCWYSFQFPESRGLPWSHIVMLDRTSSVCEPTPVVHSCIQINPVITSSSCIIRFTPADAPQINLRSLVVSWMATMALSTLASAASCSCRLSMVILTLSTLIHTTDGYISTVGHSC
jgi:hypothetical protein